MPSLLGIEDDRYRSAGAGLLNIPARRPPDETWRSQLPGTYVDQNGQLQIIPVAPNFRHFGDPLNDTRDNAELNYQGFEHPLPGWPGGGYAMPPQDWPGPNRET